ncbi:MAG: class I SAM-dependent methyltransferase [Gaiellales bacterium]
MTDLFDIDAIFGPDYLHFYGPLLSEERSDLEAELVWRLAGLEPGSAVLDAPCGHGRIANRLADMGASVTGLDIMPAFLELARRGAAERGLEVEYVQGDLRQLPFADRFDVALSWFTSFGYWDDDGCRAVLAGYARALRPGGVLLLELQNRDRVIRNFLPWVVQQVGDDVMIDGHRFDASANRIHTERTVVVGAQRRRSEFAVRMFTASELRDWLFEAGFDQVEALDGSGQPLDMESRRMVIRATRAGR